MNKMKEDKASQLYNKRNDKDFTPEINPYSMWGFGFAIAPFLIFALPFINLFVFCTPLVAIILGSIGVNRARKTKNKKTNKIKDQKSLWFGIVAIILGSLQLALIVFAIGFFALSTVAMFSYL